MRERSHRNPGQPSDLVVVFDAETRTDLTQRLLFGSYRIHSSTRLVEEGLVAADDLTANECRLLETYVAADRTRRLHLVSRRAFVDRRTLVQFTAPARIEVLDDDGHPFPGHFVDCRTLAYAYSDRGHSLESACRAFGVERPKQAYRGKHGVLTSEYVDYNREDVRATYDLFRKLQAEHVRHPL
jgi:hypothetical protein